MKNYTLMNGVDMPVVGFGTWQTPDGETAVNSVRKALACGYRHIDTAACYENEQSVGKGIAAAIAEGVCQRGEIFLTSKVWNSERGYEKTKAAFQQTISDLDVEYLDLYLIHWPANSLQFADWDKINLETWRAMTELYKDGFIRAIGVSNCKPHHLKSLLETEIVPMVNQIEYHPGYLQSETTAYCRENGIAVEAWSPLGNGDVLKDERLQQLAAKYQKSTAQLCIRWCLQNGTIPLPKSVTPARIEENLQVFDFEISPEDMKLINEMPEFGWSGLDPDKVKF